MTDDERAELTIGDNNRVTGWGKQTLPKDREMLAVVLGGILLIAALMFGVNLLRPKAPLPPSYTLPKR